LGADTAGLPAVFAMTIVAGAVEIALAPILGRLRALFPPAISGFIVAIVGLLLGAEHIERPRFHDHLVVGLLPLAIPRKGSMSK
jgi:xanthine/uracil permease